MSAYSDAVLADNPDLYWRLGEASGTVANDESSSNLDGTYSGSHTKGVVSLLPGDPGTCVDFHGNGFALGIGVRVAHARTGLTGLTFECWTNPDAPISRSEGALVTNSSDENSLSFHGLYIKGPNDPVILSDHIAVFRTRSGINGGGHGNNEIHSPGAFVYENRPHHIVGTVEVGDKMRLYIDGCEVAVSGSTITITSLQNLIETRAAMGGGGVAQPLDGRLQEVAVYLHALSPERIMEHFTIGTAGLGFWLYRPGDPHLLFAAHCESASEFDSGTIGTAVAGVCDLASQEPGDLLKNIAARPVEFWARAYMKETWPGGGSTATLPVMRFQDRNGVDQVALAIQRRSGFSDGNVHAWGNGASQAASAGNPLLNNLFQVVDVHVKIASSGGFFRVRVNGVPRLSYAGQTSWGGIAELGRIVLTNTSGAYNVVFDELIVRDDGWIGLEPCDPCLRRALAGWGLHSGIPAWHLC